MNEANAVKKMSKAEQRRKIAELMKQERIDTKAMDADTKQAVVDAVMLKFFWPGIYRAMKAFELLLLTEEQVLDCMNAFVEGTGIGSYISGCEENEVDDEVQELVTNSFC